ncbi:FAD-dependent oxidoreductase [Ochrovirga pacifica]|uniref:FAD-dependent oxidoreductase n=1 Tax=Ochrovirga pacifica TaxID=1042376 RepID=UPI00025583A3|nr:FAD-dependent oxidoreductase [Ochrovirga pacifica]
MKRRNFLKNAAGAAVAASVIPLSSCKSLDGVAEEINQGNTSATAVEGDGQWHQLGTGKKVPNPERKKTVTYDVVVVGAGVAGICSAVASARNGAKTVLINDRPVLGGNASSEIRVTLNGVNRLSTGKAERETGIVEEIMLENRLYNPQQSYPVWDHIVYDYVVREPNLTVMLNTQAIDATMEGAKIVSTKCWQLTTETEFTVKGDMFIDCSGDGLMAAKAGALYRTGREGKAEFNETYAPDQPDGWQMGASILLQGKDHGRPMPYTAPTFAKKYDGDNANHERKISQYLDGYWWVELGSDHDIIDVQEDNRHDLMGYLHGVWDYIKNSGKYPDSANYALEWVGSLPGRRESRRFIGDHILSERDLTGHRHFEDAIGYGGWSLDEHNPGGILDIKERPSFFHERFKTVYQVPFSSLYSKNIDNLMFAGRNASLTHIALSSTRIQGTCALMGQATGTAATICVNKKITPREVKQKHIKQLQEMLMRDDVYIPKVVANDPKDLAKKASAIFATSTKSGAAKNVINGISRDIDGEINHWQSEGLPATFQLEWEQPVQLSKVEIKCDTNLHKNITMRKQPLSDRQRKTFIDTVPPELLRELDLEVRVNGTWIKVGTKDRNIARLIKFDFTKIKTSAIRIQLKQTYGHKTAKLFEIRAYEA